jgi:hypothetical protein
MVTFQVLNAPTYKGKIILHSPLPQLMWSWPVILPYQQANVGRCSYQAFARSEIPSNASIPHELPDWVHRGASFYTISSSALAQKRVTTQPVAPFPMPSSNPTSVPMKPRVPSLTMTSPLGCVGKTPKEGQLVGHSLSTHTTRGCLLMWRLEPPTLSSIDFGQRLSRELWLIILSISWFSILKRLFEKDSYWVPSEIVLNLFRTI